MEKIYIALQFSISRIEVIYEQKTIFRIIVIQICYVLQFIFSFILHLWNVSDDLSDQLKISLNTIDNFFLNNKQTIYRHNILHSILTINFTLVRSI